MTDSNLLTITLESTSGQNSRLHAPIADQLRSPEAGWACSSHQNKKEPCAIEFRAGEQTVLHSTLAGPLAILPL